MTEEDFLKQKFGQVRPFSVPEGYFEHFADQMMAMLPEQDGNASAQTVDISRRPQRGWWKPLAIAASVCALVMAGGWWTYKVTSDSPSPAVAVYQESSQNYTVDQIADYAMLDNADLYSYVADSY